MAASTFSQKICLLFGCRIFVGRYWEFYSESYTEWSRVRRSVDLHIVGVRQRINEVVPVVPMPSSITTESIDFFLVKSVGLANTAEMIGGCRQL